MYFVHCLLIIVLKSKTPSDGTLLGRTSEEVFDVSLFCCWCSSFHLSLLLSFVNILHSHFAFRHHPSPFRGLLPGFYTHFILSAQLFRYLLIASATVLSGRFLPDAPLPTLTQPAFIKVSLGASSSSLNRASYWKVQNDSVLNSTIWGQSLLVVKSLVV